MSETPKYSNISIGLFLPIKNELNLYILETGVTKGRKTIIDNPMERNREGSQESLGKT